MRSVLNAVLAVGLLWLAGCAGGVRSPEPPPYRVIAYVAGWSMPASVPAEKLTHINFAFARIDPGGRVVFEDPKFAPALASLVELKQRNPQLKILVSVGGWEAEGFSDAALTDESRATFVQSAVEFLREHRLDGVDLDWEYPGQGVAGIKFRVEDKQNFTRLLRAMRSALDAASTADGRTGDNRYLLTIASADREYFDHTEMDKLHVDLDWINVMAYDFFNSLTETTGHHAGLYASEEAAPEDRNADASIRQHLAAGIPADKLVLGVPFYGRGFSGVVESNNGLNRPWNQANGAHPYSEIATTLIASIGPVRYWDERAQAPYLWNARSRVFITYDDPQSIRVKAAYVRKHALGGMMFWELSQDRDGELLDVIVKTLR